MNSGGVINWTVTPSKDTQEELLEELVRAWHRKPNATFYKISKGRSFHRDHRRRTYVLSGRATARFEVAVSVLEGSKRPAGLPVRPDLRKPGRKAARRLVGRV